MIRGNDNLLRRTTFAFLGLTALLPAVRAVRHTYVDVRAFAHVSNSQIDELSGIVKSRRYPDTYWVNNDSGDSPRIFAIHRNGTSASQDNGIAISGATNVDWEDITQEGGNLVVSDMGNNKNKRHDLGVYILPEPDPRRSTPAPAPLHIPIAYPDQKDFPPKGALDFDCEALFSLRGKLYFITKQRLNAFFPGNGAKLYALDTRNPNQVNVLRKVDQRTLDGWVTSAAVSPDGKTLAVLTQAPSQSVWLFSTAARGERFLSTSARRIPISGAKQCEGICWDSAETLIVTNEQGDMYEVKTSQAKLVR